jgi:cell fate (sporulation/competence/biofilm development) regulator YlbF (YheA/YmcA/DUF963 family)
LTEREAVKDFEEYLSNSKEFMRLKMIYEEIGKSPMYKESITRFKGRQNAIHAAKDEQEIQQIVDELNSDYESITETELIKQYFSAIDEFNKLIGTVVRHIHAELEERLQTR